MPKTKVAIVNYLNTRPFIYGLQQSEIVDEIELIECSPAQCASCFFDQTVDISLVPTGALIHPTFPIINSYGIASDGPVSSVCLFSQVPLKELTTVYLDYQSRTSVLLIQILFKHFWKREVEFVESYPGYELNIKGSIGGVVIGDRAIKLKPSFAYIYDLGQMWKEFSNLPFVYAVWVANTKPHQEFITKFNKAIASGVDSIDILIDTLPPNSGINFEAYFYENIKFKMDENYLEGMNYFLKLASELLLIEQY